MSIPMSTMITRNCTPITAIAMKTLPTRLNSQGVGQVHFLGAGDGAKSQAWWVPRDGEVIFLGSLEKRELAEVLVRRIEEELDRATR